MQQKTFSLVVVIVALGIIGVITWAEHSLTEQSEKLAVYGLVIAAILFLGCWSYLLDFAEKRRNLQESEE